jgi:cytochrome c-type biogenesis protein CcmH/NrfF
MQNRSPLFYVFRLIFLVLGFFIVRAIYRRVMKIEEPAVPERDTETQKELWEKENDRT